MISLIKLHVWIKRNIISCGITGIEKSSRIRLVESCFPSTGTKKYHQRFPSLRLFIAFNHHLIFNFLATVLKVGFLIALDKRNHSHNIATNEFPDLPQNFDYIFLQEIDAYFKNLDMRDLDNEIGDLDAFINFDFIAHEARMIIVTVARSILLQLCC